MNIKIKTIEIKEKMSDFKTNNEEGSNFYEIPDLGTESSIIEEEIERLTKERIEEIENNTELSEDYKAKKIGEIRNELKQEREKRFNELHRLFAERGDRIHTVNQLLKAYSLFEREEEYIVQEGKGQIVEGHAG